MEFISNGRVYENLQLRNNILIKNTTLCKNSWDYIKDQKFHFVCNPLEVNDGQVLLPYLNHYHNLYESKRYFSNKAIYLLLIKQLKYIMLLHKMNIVHGDIFSLNIMVNDILDLKLIDFDYSIVNGNIPEENIYYDDDISDEEKIYLTKINDVKDTILTYLHYLTHNCFSEDVVCDLDFDRLEAPTFLKDDLHRLLEENKVPEDYFLNDLVKTFTMM